MTASTTPGVEFYKEIFNGLMYAINEGTKQAAKILWEILISFLSQYWFSVLMVLFTLFVFVTLKAMMGRWSSLGSFLYNLFYFGTLFIIGLIWGPEVFVNDYFNAACAVILYPICYEVVGVILDKFNFRR